MKTRTLTTKSERTRDVIVSLLVIFVLLGVTALAAYLSMFIGVNTGGCDFTGDCNGFLVTVGWLGGLLIPPLLAAAGIILTFRFFATRRRAVFIPLLTLGLVIVIWFAGGLLTQWGLPGFSLRDLLP